MKIAHLILTHKNPEQVTILLRALSHPSFHFFIHVDKKTDISKYHHLLRLGNVAFIEKRATVYWGAWGVVQATINGFKEILPGGFDYINVISGQDLPIKPTEFIYDYFVERKGAEFITCDIPDQDWENVSSRINDYHLINWRIPGRFRLSEILTKILPPRTFPLDYQIVGRSNWFALTNEAVKYSLKFLKDNPRVIRYFKYCWGADEFVFSTILYNSKFKRNIKGQLMYVDWAIGHSGHPRDLLLSDLPKLQESDKLFARKFDLSVDREIFKAISNFIGRKDIL